MPLDWNGDPRKAAAAELLRRREARRDLLSFTQYTYPKYRAGRVHRAIAEKLTLVALGVILRLMIFCPPRHGKSRLASIEFPAWYLGKFPDKEIISASYGSELANDFGREVRNLIGGPEYGVLFDTRLAVDSQRKDRWHTNEGGGYVAAGVGGSITGRGAHILNIDDPLKGRANAESQSVREEIWNWYRGDAYPRLMPGGAVVLTMTRWHEDDLAGRLLNAQAEGGDKWEILNLPALADPNDPLGRAPGEALWPEAYPVEVLKQIKSVQGEYDWEALYQQRPRPPGGSFFLEDDLLVEIDGKKQPIPLPRTCLSVFAVIDTAVKTGKGNDGTGVVFCAFENLEVPRPLIILDWDYVQIEGDLLITWLPSVLQRLEEFAKLCKARMGSIGVFIEDAASGMILLQQAQRQGLPAEAIDSKLTSVGKVERAINVSGYVRTKKVALAETAYTRTLPFKGATRNHLLSQILGFHVDTKDQGQDDLLDCFTYSIALSLGNGEGF